MKEEEEEETGGTPMLPIRKEAAAGEMGLGGWDGGSGVGERWASLWGGF